MFNTKNFLGLVWILTAGISLAVLIPTSAQDPAPEKKGILKRIVGIFGKKEPDPQPNVPAAAAIAAARPDSALTPPGGSNRVSDGVQRYPHIRGYETRMSEGQKEIEYLIDRIYEEYERKISGFDGNVLGKSTVGDLPDLPPDAISDWASSATNPIWVEDRDIPQGIGEIYLRAIIHSNQIRVFKDSPLISETRMQEADGAFDLTVFGSGQYSHSDRPVGNDLDINSDSTTNQSTTGTGTAADQAATEATLQRPITRLTEDRADIELGLRQRNIFGGEFSLSNRFNTLSNNSGFLRPDNQGGGEFVIRYQQPLLQGSGYHYNTAPLKVAKLDARAASAEFIRQVQNHLLEINRSYWALYFARSSFLLRKSNFSRAELTLKDIEARKDLDTARSELARSYALVQRRKASLIRSEMAIKNAEERLRALVNDPQFGIGTGGEVIPTTLPVISRPIGGLKQVATEALYNRPEIDQAFAQMRAATVRRDVQRNELQPQFNLLAESSVAGLEGDNDFLGGYGDGFSKGRPSWLVGLEFEMPLERNFAKARARRGELELRQQANQLRTVIDTVLLESIVTFREISTAYRDMQGKYQSFIASQGELEELEARLEVAAADAEAGGQTTSYYLQLILDAQERVELAQDSVLEAVVIYNVAFASLERAKGTYLRYQGVSIDRLLETSETHPTQELDKLLLNGSSSSKSSSGYRK